jgi:hypothetical protein
MKATVQLGDRITLEIEEAKPIDTLHMAIALGYPRRVCNICGAKDGFYFTTNKDKEANTYVSFKCQCGAKSKLGQYKAGGYFWHDFEQYVPKGDVEQDRVFDEMIEEVKK